MQGFPGRTPPPRLGVEQHHDNLRNGHPPRLSPQALKYTQGLSLACLDWTGLDLTGLLHRASLYSQQDKTGLRYRASQIQFNDIYIYIDIYALSSVSVSVSVSVLVLVFILGMAYVLGLHSHLP
jgi:hypothetical protein